MTTKILVLEDYPALGKVVKYVLGNFPDIEFDVVANDEQVIEQFPEKDYDMVFMDVGVRHIDLPDLMQKLQALNTRDVPFVGWTVQPQQKWRDEAHACGIKEVRMKPLSEDAVFEVCETYLPGRVKHPYKNKDSQS